MKEVKEYSLELDREYTLSDNRVVKVFDVTIGNRHCWQLVIISEDNMYIDRMSGNIIQAGYLPSISTIEQATGWRMREIEPVNAMIETLTALNQNNLEIIKIKAECSEF